MVRKYVTSPTPMCVYVCVCAIMHINRCIRGCISHVDMLSACVRACKCVYVSLRLHVYVQISLCVCEMCVFAYSCVDVCMPVAYVQCPCILCVV